MRIKRLNNELQSKFKSYLLKRPSENAIYLYDLEKEYPARVEFFLALDEEKIKGFNIIWTGYSDFPYLHIVADDKDTFINLFESAKSYINRIKRLIIFSEFSPILKEKIKINGIPNYRMNLKKGTEKLSIIHNIKILSEEDLESVENLLSEDRDLYNEKALKLIRDSFLEKSFFGCYKNGQLVSFARTYLLYSSIAVAENIYTKKTFRRKGIGKSTVSYLIEELFYKRKRFDEIQLLVDKENLPAINLYKQLGFKVLKEYSRFKL